MLEATAERDALAAELADFYPAAVERLADLAARVAANDAAIEQVNRLLPDGARWVPSVELVARKLNGFMESGVFVPRITQHMRLPEFRYGRRSPYLWPSAVR